MRVELGKLRESAAVSYAALAAIVLAFCARAVPFDNEYVYLLRLRRTYDSSFLLNDISFAAPGTEHWLFNHVFGLFTYFASLTTIAWTGRILCWAGIVYALQRLARHWTVPVWMSATGIAIWIASGQSIVGGEWMLGTFEAKCVAYICLLFALDGFLRGRIGYPSALLGLTFSMHPAVGTWSILAALIAMLFCRDDLRDVARAALIVALFSLPGILPLLLSGSSGASAEDWRYLELVRFPHVFDPFSWPKTAIALCYLQLVFCLLIFRRGSRSRVDRFIIAFLTSLGVFFTAGILLRAAGRSEEHTSELQSH